MALLLEGSGWGLWLTRTVVVLPVVTAMAVIGEIWRIIYFPAPNGFLNSILGSFGLPAGTFLDSPSTALVSIGAVGIWAGAPYNMVVFLAGLAGIDRNLYEAAAVDGASTLRRIWSITIPGLAGSFIIVLTLAAIRALGIFTEVYVLTGGGPAGSTTVWMTAVFSLGFERNNIGVASAASVLLLLTTMGLTILTQFLTRRKTDR
jgi:multiple sugar transport system permease protein